MSVTRNQRHTRQHRCEVCDGAEEDPRGKGKRCTGFTSVDGEWCQCSREELAGALQQNNAGLFSHRMHGECRCGAVHGAARESNSITAEYDYRDENGALLFQVVRKIGKQFRQRKPDGDGGWSWKLEDVRRVPYLLPELLASDTNAPVFVCEGEKDVETAVALGLVATCNPGGAGKWHFVAAAAGKALVERDVIVFADADDVGRRHAQQVAESLKNIARSVRVVEAPPPHKDLTDYVQAGASVADLLALRPPEARVNAPPLNDLAPPEDDWNPTDPREAPPAEARPIVKPVGWAWRGADDVFFGKKKPARWLVRDIGLLPGRPTLLSGPSGGAKTILAQSLGISVASGRPIWDRFMREEGCLPIVTRHIDCDLGLDDTEHRYRRILAGFPGAPIPHEVLIANFKLVSFPMPRIDLRRPETRDILRRELEGVGFCILDALRGLASGNENDSEFRQALDMLTAVSGDTGCAFLLLHHTGHLKIGPNGKPLETDDSAGRGTTGIKDASGTVLKILGSRGKRRLTMMKPPGRMGVDWQGAKYDLHVDDVPGELVDGEGLPLRVRVSPELEKSKDEIADEQAKAAHARDVAFREACMAILRRSTADGFEGGVERLVGIATQALRSTPGMSGMRVTDARAIVNGMIEDEVIHQTGRGKASRIRIGAAPQQALLGDSPS